MTQAMSAPLRPYYARIDREFPNPPVDFAWIASLEADRHGIVRAMKYRPLGATGIEVSEIGLGTWPAGGSIHLAGAPTGYGTVPETEAIRGIHRALDQGVNFFDTADTYGLGRAERLLGQGIAARRGQAIVATKAGWVPDGAERWVKDLSADHLRAAALRSRARLGVETIDVFQLHAVPEAGAESDEAFDTLEELKTRGVVRATGASVGADMAAGLRLVEAGRIDVLQVSFNLLQQTAAQDLFEVCRRKKIGIISSIPLAYGFLSGRYTRNTVFSKDDWRSRLTREEVAGRVARVEELRFLTGDGTRSLVHASIQFVLAHPHIATTIPGFRSVEQVNGILEAMEAHPISDIEIARARELGRVWSTAAPART
jgi:aryl-alcohol dehydrogenase-like predicted oxidoreductase